MTSCTSSPKNEVKPRIDIPDPYVDGVCVVEQFDPDKEYTENDIVMPLWFYKKIVMFISLVKTWYFEN